MSISQVAWRLAGALGVAGGLAGLAVAGLRRSLPRTAGELRIPALSAPAQVLRDRWGVPHIYAANDADLFLAQGYVHAQDRLWQMEFQRRLGHGRLAELVGPAALDTDRFVRVLGFGRVARQEAATLSPTMRAVLEAYALGVNTFIEQNRHRLPPEFTLLRLDPEPWQPADSLAWAKIMALSLSGNWTQELLRARLVAALGVERTSQLDPDYPDDHPLIVPSGAHYRPDLGEDALRLVEGAEPFLHEGSGQGSNNWVVAGQRSATGMPLLANDPHLSISMPSIWYENHLEGGSYRVAGASFVGAPGVVIGHNQRIAWGVTNGMSDTQDLYIERFDPADPARYLYKGEWLAADVVAERIQVKGQAEPHIETVRITRHGPVISPLIGSAGGEQGQAHAPALPGAADAEALALRWTALEPAGRILSAVLAINRASDWTSFRAALEDWHVPPQNFVYADVDGHIGYALGGDIPIRTNSDGRLPVPGWNGEHEWAGVVPHAELPHSFDPPEGFAISANNRIVAEEFPHHIPGEYLNGYRAARIRQLILQIPRHTPESFARIHGDRRSLPGLALAALAGRLPAEHPLARAARDRLASWDGELGPDSVAGTIYATLRERLLLGAYEILGHYDRAVGIGAFASLPARELRSRATPATLRRLAERDDAWLPPGRTWDALLAEVWEATLAELRARYGDSVDTWQYGRDHTLTIRHPLGSVPALGRLFNRGPFPTGGDIDTVCLGELPHVFAGLPYYVAPSYRQIIDLGDWNRSRSIHPTGQSGHPASRHYTDFIKPWLQVEYHPMPWGRAQVEEATAERLILRP